jgi:hypothetical protein
MTTDMLIAQTLWGAIGFAYLMYARKQKAPVPLVAGLSMIALPYFISNFWLVSICCIILMFSPKFIDID